MGLRSNVFNVEGFVVEVSIEACIEGLFVDFAYLILGDLVNLLIEGEELGLRE